MSKSRRVLVGVVVALAVVGLSACAKAPVDAISQAQSALQAAGDAEAATYAPDAWDAALAASARALATSLGWPVLADPASGLRAGAGLDGWLMHGADLLLRDVDTAAALQPELVVRFGGQPTSKALSLWMARHASAEVWLVDPAAGFRDPQHRAGRMLRMGSRQFCDLGSEGTAAPSAAVRPWLARWQHADRLARAALADALALESRLLAPHVAQLLWSAMPEGAALYVANSMAIRDIDAFAGPRAGELRVLANRGVNGIDGQVSAALGAATALRVPTVLWCGDLTLLHDLSGLLAGRLHGADLTIVVTNDDGGGIFEYLPVAQSVPRSVFEPLFAVPHGLDLGELARGLGWNSSRVAAARPLAEALSRALRGGLNLIEVPVDRAANTAMHLAVNEAVRSRLQAEPLP